MNAYDLREFCLTNQLPAVKFEAIFKIVFEKDLGAEEMETYEVELQDRIDTDGESSYNYGSY